MAMHARAHDTTARVERAHKSLAALGAIIGVTCQILFLAYYPVLLGLIDLSDTYAAAPASDASAIATAASTAPTPLDR